jgi:hypothetical protein
MAAAKTTGKRQTRPKTSEQDLVDDGRRVLAAAKKSASAFAKADANRKQKRISAAFLTGYAKTIDEANRARGAKTRTALSMVTATDLEVVRRKNVMDRFIAIRGDISTTYPENRPLSRAFGVGANVSLKSTPGLLTAATDVIEAFQDPEHRKLAVDAGVNAARISDLQRAHDELAAADTEQNLRLGTRKAQTKSKDALLRELKKTTAYVRKVAAIVLREDKAKLALFSPTIARRATKKRAVAGATKPPV